MKLQVDLPQEVLDALGPEPQKDVLESVLLHLVQQNKMTVAKAGNLLGMDRMAAIRWYTSQGFYYPDFDDQELANELEHANLD